MNLKPCHNRPPKKPTMRVQDGWADDGWTRVPVMIDVPDRFTEPCHYARGNTEKGRVDETCGDCKWKPKEKVK